MMQTLPGELKIWLLFKEWCEGKGGTPIRGTGLDDHVCFIGPLPDDTIEPGNEVFDVDIHEPERPLQSMIKQLELKLRISKLRIKEEELNYKRTGELIKSMRDGAKCN
jgi:hypothetical protein